MDSGDITWEWQIIKIKADLLCMGIRSNETAEAIYNRQNPCKDWKTGNVGLHIILENGSYVLVTLSHFFDQKSPYSIGYDKGKLTLFKEKEIACQIKEVIMPNWYSKKTSTMISMPSFFLHEGKAFLHQAYSGCDYHSIGQQCRFCGTGSVWRIGTPLEISEVVDEAVKENCEYHVCLGGGTRLPLIRNIEYFSECLVKIRENNEKVPIWIEMIPPESDKNIAKLTESGATSFGFNLEIWNETLRKKICPGKSHISKNRYLNAMKKAIEYCDLNRVGSVLLVGLEPIESSIKGSITLASNGVQPCMIPFKPWNKSIYRNHAHCNPDNLIKASGEAVKAMIENNIDPKKNEGCLLCDGCTIDHDIYNLIQKKGGWVYENSCSRKD